MKSLKCRKLYQVLHHFLGPNSDVPSLLIFPCVPLWIYANCTHSLSFVGFRLAWGSEFRFRYIFFFSHRHSLPHTGSCHHKKCNAPSLQDVKLYPNDHLKNSELSLLYKFTLTTAHHFSCLAEPGICFMLLVLLEKGICRWDCCGLLLLSRGGDLIIQSLSSGHSDPFTCRSTDPRVEIYYYSLGTRIAEK